jgi:hypothetical protein
MTDEQLDAVYTATCRALTAAGPGRGEIFLARLALLLMHEVDDTARIERAIAAAGEAADGSLKEEIPCKA